MLHQTANKSNKKKYHPVPSRMVHMETYPDSSRFRNSRDFSSVRCIYLVSSESGAGYRYHHRFPNRIRHIHLRSGRKLSAKTDARFLQP